MIYTSNFANLKNLNTKDCVSIARGTPFWFKGKTFTDLCPRWDIVMNHKKGIITNEEYIDTYYNDSLNELDPKQIIKLLDNKVLLCWCGKDKFCHRNLVRDWLNKYKQDICQEI